MKIKYNNNITLQLKSSLNCFEAFNSRIVEGLVHNTKDFNYINIGFKYLITLHRKSKHNDVVVLKAVSLETIFYDVSVVYVNIKKILRRLAIWEILIKAYEDKCLIKGRILNSTRGGYSIGIYGFIGFLPKKILLNSKNTLASVFWVTKLNHLKKTFVLSQKKIHNSVSKVLFKLASRIMYISKT